MQNSNQLTIFTTCQISQPHSYALNNPVVLIDPDGMSVEECPGCKERIVGTPTQKVTINSIEANYNKKGKLISVTVNFDIIKTQNVEVVHGESGNVVESRTDVIASKGSATQDPQGAFQVNKNTGEIFNTSGDIVVAETLGSRTSTFHHSDISLIREGNTRTDVVEVAPTKVSYAYAQEISKATNDYTKSITPTAIQEYWDFVLSPKEEKKQNLNVVSHPNPEHRTNQKRRHDDSLRKSMDSLKILHRKAKGVQ